MTVDPAGGRETDDRDGSRASPPQDAGHLDRDPEALEDPVHRGDAEHQREGHQRDDEAAPERPA